mgnify:CR=1 FL=1
MIYGSTNIKILFGTLSITHKKKQTVRHIPFTNKNAVIEKGKPATIINCKLKAETISELATLMNILNSEEEKELTLNTVKYKRVIAGASSSPEPKNDDETYWLIDAGFIALDPVAYNASTGDALYG